MAFQSKSGVRTSVEDVETNIRDKCVYELRPDDKWNAVSSMQKACRRGWILPFQNAVRQAYALDPAYASYRLAVLAFEDLIGGRPEVAQTFAKGWGKKHIKQHGGLDYLLEVVSSWPIGIKDRLASDLLACIYWLPEWQRQHGMFEHVLPDHAFKLFMNTTEPWWSRALGLWRVWGTEHYTHPSLPKKIQGHVGLIETSGMPWIQDEHKIQALKMGVVQKESSVVFLPLVWSSIDEAKKQDAYTLKKWSGEIQTPYWIGPWLSIGLDKHTRDGQRAWSRWIKTTEAKAWMKESGVESEDVKDMVSHLLFVFEGGVLDESANYPMKKQVFEDVWQRRFGSMSQWSGKTWMDHLGSPRHRAERWARLMNQPLRTTPMPWKMSDESLPVNRHPTNKKSI